MGSTCPKAKIYYDPKPEWYQLDPSVFDALVGEHGTIPAFQREAMYRNTKLWNLFAWMGMSEMNEIMIRLYRAGILRHGGPMNVCPECGQEIISRHL